MTEQTMEPSVISGAVPILASRPDIDNTPDEGIAPMLDPPKPDKELQTTENHIFLAIPVHTTVDARAQTALDVAIKNSRCHVEKFIYIGDSMISRVRNRQISRFWKMRQFNWYMTIDSDIEILNNSREDNVFDRLVAHGLDWVGALVSKKTTQGFRCASVPAEDNMPSAPCNKLIEMIWLGAGITLISRRAIEKLIASHPELGYNGTQSTLGEMEFALYMPFIFAMPNGFRKYLSEDWAICARWHDVGGRVWADCSIRTRHWGDCGYVMWDQVEKGVRREA